MNKKDSKQIIKANSAIENLSPYVNGHHKQDILLEPHRIMKLDSNESTIGPSPKVFASLSQAVQNTPLHWYPDVYSSELIQALSNYTQLGSQFIQTFGGSDHALECICRTYLENGDQVLIPLPTYDHFRVYAQTCGAKMKTFIHQPVFESNMDQLIDSITREIKMVYLVNPNNPTGILYSLSEIKNLLIQFPETLFIVDEAYFEFCQITAASLVPHHSNLIVTRSFSKAFGLAGLRCGYILTDPQNLESINKVRVGKNVPTLGQIAAIAALNDLSYMQDYIEEVKNSAEWLKEKLISLDLEVKTSLTNYLMVEVQAPKELCEYLADRNIFIRDRSHFPGLEKYIRITIGHQLLMKRFWKEFKQVPKKFLYSKVEEQPSLGF